MSIKMYGRSVPKHLVYLFGVAVIAILASWIFWGSKAPEPTATQPSKTSLTARTIFTLSKSDDSGRARLEHVVLQPNTGSGETMTFLESPAFGEHFVTFPISFAPGATLTADVLVSIKGDRQLRLYFTQGKTVEDKATAFCDFSLASDKPIGCGAFEGGKAISQKREVVEGKLAVSVTFFALPSQSSASIRAQILDPKKGALFPGNLNSGISLEELSVKETPTQ